MEPLEAVRAPPRRRGAERTRHTHLTDGHPRTERRRRPWGGASGTRTRMVDTGILHFRSGRLRAARCRRGDGVCVLTRRCNSLPTPASPWAVSHGVIRTSTNFWGVAGVGGQ